MPTYADKMSLQELIELVRQNDVDVPEMQRTFGEKQSWVVHLVDSLYHDIPIGQILIWLPDNGHRPTAGRYQQNSASNRWLLDGQQRITALLAALGIRPPWIPEDRWHRMVREPLQVAVGARRDGQLIFRALRPDVAGEVALGDLLIADQVTDVLGPTDVLSVDVIQKYCALREKLLNSEIALAYLPGEYRTAALGFSRRNQKSSATPLRREELSLCLLGAVYPPLQREYIDPLLPKWIRHVHNGQTAVPADLPLLPESVIRQHWRHRDRIANGAPDEPANERQGHLDLQAWIAPTPPE